MYNWWTEAQHGARRPPNTASRGCMYDERLSGLEAMQARHGAQSDRVGTRIGDAARVPQRSELRACACARARARIWKRMHANLLARNSACEAVILFRQRSPCAAADARASAAHSFVL
eukprot:1369875-Pleurochrysis_carterae.AAC.1